MKFVAFERPQQGTAYARRLRHTGRTPGIVYGGSSATPTLIELDHNALWHALKKEAFHASILEMELDGKNQQVILREVQYHPYKLEVLHIDFQRVDKRTRLRKKVPLHFQGETDSPAVKADKCLINHAMTELEIECLATALPESITVDLSQLAKGQSFHLNDLQLPKGIKAVTHGRGNLTIASAVEPKEEVVAPAADAAPAAEAAAAKAKK